jgi:hypothetical protein
MNRIYSITIYLSDSPTPVYIDNVEHIQTEGNLLRIISESLSTWYPLCNVAYIKENSKSYTLKN